ncbi:MULTISPECIES: pyridoxal phosphate-dependent aminotransferase [Rhodococcus]|uniref:alanine transaminase n=1 Tax=Rhodococcus baikonurensis TaxID=172041 RepID=A0ABV5XLD1_9NOCA|nr:MULTISPECIES: pyridoxal phosphate-dependent aminotransferase [Rhodococcus]MDN5548420.1 pyridoxal phosphate-dependent aminotransferase [Rhodococcus sp. (in: high G+C Gram-positive bacteria)]NHP16068.1 pyridoxal phosphate-dependent aminotransferase [Rhodococcus sp. IC4_135]PBI96677.1 Glutamate-pyruvate aminotransferase AlaA [Rhodococcus erythropolis]QQM20655.1 pyridoxal phosphate-dependent aminotransferase [Rhodococcus sp. P-2]RQO44469.1 pyridoxal phosphate-dependent aminotransferase [Rhodoco
MNTPIDQARKLENVRYDIRGRILDKTEELEDQGHTILRLNVGNPAPFGFEAPDEIMMAMIRNLPTAQGYCDSRGLYSARTAVVQYYQTRGITDVTVDEIYLGNGVSELITLTMQALCNPEDEILIPAPDYPLWTASVSLAGGTPVHYLTDESQGWAPDFDDLEARISPRTRGIVVINPNNPTGAVYSTEVLQRFVDIARKHDLMLFADEIYEKIVYDGRSMTNLASMTGRDVLCLTYSGLSKAYRVCGFRAGWLAITGPLERASSFIEGIKLLANMRMCANVPAQHAIQTALGGRQSIEDLLLPQGRLTAQRDLAHSTLNSIDGISCQQADGALYLFPKLDVDKFGIVDDERFVLDLLESEKILVSHGRAFNWIEPDHFRLVTLPNTDDLSTALERLGNFLSSYSQ